MSQTVKHGNRQAGTGRGNAPYANDTNLATGNSFTITAGAANVVEIAIQFTDGADTPVNVAGPINIDVWLSDDSAGTGLTGTSASGTVQAKSASGTDLTAYVAKKALRVQTLATGVYTLEITDTAKTGFYIAVENPYTGVTSVSPQLVTADYGA
jgi:hypothetical protein